MEKKYSVNTLVNVEILQTERGKIRSFINRGEFVCENKDNIAIELVTGEEILLVNGLIGLPIDLPNQIMTKGHDKNYYLMIMKNADDDIGYGFAKIIVKLLNKLEKKRSDKKKTVIELNRILEEYAKYKEKKYPRFVMD